MVPSATFEKQRRAFGYRFYLGCPVAIRRATRDQGNPSFNFTKKGQQQNGPFILFYFSLAGKVIVYYQLFLAL